MTAQMREPQSGPVGSHAVVIGGSMAGLLAARVLTDHFDRVTLIERDEVGDGAAPRKGVPQGRHPHAVLARGQDIIERLFPGITAALANGGATMIDIGDEFRWYHFGGYKARFRSGIIGPFMSRPFLETEVRRRVLALRNLEYVDGCGVMGLVTSPDRARVTGVTIERLRKASGTDGTATAALDADLVVDATGRGSHSPRWLESLGYARPRESVIKVDIGYTTRLYRRRPSDLPGAKAVFVGPTPPRDKRCGALFPIEGDRWIVSLCGWLGDHAPIDEQGFLEYARTLAAPDVYDVIKNAEPLTTPVVHKLPSNLRRHYEKMARLPDGFIVTGDALCSFNPVYGQGMTVSALEADALDACLTAERRGNGACGVPGRGFPRRFFREVAKVVDVPWTLAGGADFQYPETQGRKAPGTDAINWYVGKVHRAATRDPEVYRAFLNVMNMTHPPATLFDARIALRVMRGRLNGRRVSEGSLRLAEAT